MKVIREDFFGQYKNEQKTRSKLIYMMAKKAQILYVINFIGGEECYAANKAAIEEVFDSWQIFP
ncbi:MAG: hypothetical protein LWX56_10000 [Ignavibacteria bacterium]|nr:hypothetical protein [Ignavibacteria bacterium]